MNRNLSEKNKPTNLNIHPSIDKRVYRVKKPAFDFFCPLCRMERQVAHRSRLSPMNYLQIVMVSFVLVTLTFDRMQAYALVWPFLVYAGLEGARHLLFKRDVPCPHCGFDASWYKKDIKMARQLVSKFWQNKKNNSEPSKSSSPTK